MVDAGDALRRGAAAIAVVVALVAGVACTSAGSGATPAVSASGAAAEAPSATAAGSFTSNPTATVEVTSMTTQSADATPKLAIMSTAFAEGEAIPQKFSCRGADVSPPLAWQGVPSSAGALVLFVDDPDGRDWVHWSVLDLPARDGELPEGVDPHADPPQQGKNDFGKVGYGGPCPPSGTHHYRFTLYALAAPLGLSGHPDGSEVRRALGRANVIERVRLTGTFRA